MSSKKGILIFISATLIVIEAVPKCKNFNTTSVVCTNSKNDYKLVRGLVSDNNRTINIVLRGCRIKDVEYESFNELTSLEHLDLSQNKIKTLKLGVLDEPKNVVSLNLSHNQLTGFPLGLFDQMTKIQVLDLKENHINKLELGIFDTLHDLTNLDVSGNDILGKDINTYIFDHSKHITDIDFSKNNMADAPEGLLEAFESLEILRLSRCFLKEVPAFAVKSNLGTMRILILSTNQITSLDQGSIFVNLEELRVLDLHSNNIESINSNVFSPLKELQKIELRNNRLKSIPIGLFQNMPKLIVLDLYGNKIQDAPVNAFRGSPLKYLNLSNNKLTYLVDNFCLELKNSGANLKKFIFDINPWQCSCLLDLIREVKRMEIEYNSGKYNGEAAVCETASEFNCKRHQV